MFVGAKNSLQKTVLLMVLLNAFTTPLMLSTANVALPVIAIDLDLSASSISWVPMAYLMASAMFVLIFSRVADLVGRKRIYLFGTASVIITSILALLAPSGILLIGARFLQGMSAAMLYSTQIAIISSVFSPQQRGRAIGLTVSAIYFGLTCGPLLGGLLVDSYGWRISFFVHIPLAVVALLIGYFKVSGDWVNTDVGHFDIKGTGIYMLIIACLCIGISLMPQVTGFLLLFIGLAGIYIFVQVEQRLAYPLLDISLFQTNKVFTYSCCASLIIYAAIFANVFLVSFYLQFIKGLTPTVAGCIMMVQPLTMALFSPWAGRLSDKIEPRILTSAGIALTALGLFMLAMLSATSTISYLLGALLLTGLGFSFFSSPNANAIMNNVDKKNYGQAGSSMAIARLIGQMMSMVLVTMVFTIVVGHLKIEPTMYDSLQLAISSCFFISVGLCIPAIIFSLIRGRIHS